MADNLTYPIAPGITQRTKETSPGVHAPAVVLVDASGNPIVTLPVSGPVTDAQLRAAALPVSGPLTDLQLRDDPVAVIASPGTQSESDFFAVRLSNGTAFLDAPQTGPKTVNATASGSTPLIAAPAAGNQIVVYQASIHQRGTTTVIVGLRAGTGGTNVVTVPLGTDMGSGSLVPLGRGWILPAATGLFVNLSVAGNVQVNLFDYSVQAVPA